MSAQSSRLRLERVAARPSRNVEKSTPTNPDADDGLHLKDEAARVLAVRMQRLTAHSGDSSNLFELFHVQFVDFVKFDGERYVPVEWRHEATHQLYGSGVGVCAFALRPRLKKTNLKITHALPKSAPAYKPAASVGSKRNVLRFLVTATKARVPLRALPKLSSSECDLLYLNIIRASKLLKFRHALS